MAVMVVLGYWHVQVRPLPHHTRLHRHERVGHMHRGLVQGGVLLEEVQHDVRVLRCQLVDCTAAHTLMPWAPLCLPRQLVLALTDRLILGAM